ncbi:Chymotrypsin inhibitor-like Protein [Tribolium castaneum]|uniref:Chymotrypsin inhibitor-like Protein n=1 Tax=Tribolium castaneum TaxID=7070 RepID=A0A139WLN1_TRICA|nr:PREDICTED: chymotrypsin inhibitor-like [Tribolium castaneum]KYB28803.1 Chymotrypsin inhibitor-like Protein [Tribolium castaneum]|eukprot:XP_008190813.1 PREDICTED: chymotrypsin inhibitor-like [Tribolium castaneum]
MKFLLIAVVLALSLNTIYCYTSNQCLGENEVYNSCGSPCISTCTNRQFANCEARCEEGCFCKDGYLRDEETGSCVLPKDCSTGY